MSISAITQHCVVLSDDLLASAQCDAAGAPRFTVTRPVRMELSQWLAIVAAENDGGVDAEFRLFLDAQLGAGDVLIDLAPDIGFLAFSAATTACDGILVTVCAEDADAADRLHALAGGARATTDVRVIKENLARALAELVAKAQRDSQRVFLRATPSQLPSILAACDASLHDGTLAAICWQGDDTEASYAAHRALRERDLPVFWMGERNGEAELFAVAETFACGPLFAINMRARGFADSRDVADRPAETQTPHAAHSHCSVESKREPFNFISPYCHTGYGIAGANLLRAALDLGAPLSFFPIDGLHMDTVAAPALEAALLRSEHIDLAAPSLRLLPAYDQRRHIGHGPRIGFPIFELTHFTNDERQQLRELDRILVCSEWAKRIIRENDIGDVPVSVVPLGVDRTIFHERLAPSHRANETIFLQGGKLEARKGQRELLRAFEAAFSPRDQVHLVLLCQNPFLSAAEFERRAEPFRQSPLASRITLITTAFSHQREMAHVMATADCGVFPVRAEGWNLEALEMLSMGKSVIATDYSAHTQFLTHENAHLISVDALEDVPADLGIGQWAAFGDAQHEQLVVHLRSVHHARQQDGPIRNRAGILTAEKFSWNASGVALLDAVEASLR
jgi:glycosyltransferase involved in cell wall biosynthesis